MKRRIAAFFLILILAGATVAVKILSSPRVEAMIREILVQQAEQHLGVGLEIGELEYNFFLTAITLERVVLNDLQGGKEGIELRRLKVDFDPTTLFRGVVAIREIQLEGMKLEVVRDEKGGFLVDPILPVWRKEKKQESLKIRPLRLELGDISLIDAHVSYRDMPAGITTDLEGLLIRLGRARFDPPEYRRISIHAGEGDLTWKAFPEGRNIHINSLRTAFIYMPDGIQVTKLSLSSGPVLLDLSVNIPLTDSGLLSGNLSLSANIGELPWLIDRGSGDVRLDGKISGDLSKPVLTGTLESGEVQVSDRQVRKFNADIVLDPYHVNLENMRGRYREEDLSGGMEIRFVRGLPFEMFLSTTDYPLNKLLREVQGGSLPLKGNVSATCRLEGQFTPGAEADGAAVALDGAVNIPLAAVVDRKFDFELAGIYSGNGFAVDLLQISSGSLILDASGRIDPSGPSLQVSLSEPALESWEDLLPEGRVKGAVNLDADLNGPWDNPEIKVNAVIENPGWDQFSARELTARAQIVGNVGSQWKNPEVKLDMVVNDPEWNQYTADVLKAHLDIDSEGINCPLAFLEESTSALSAHGFYPWDSDAEEVHWSVEVASGSLEDFIKVSGRQIPLSGEISGMMDFVLYNKEVTGFGDVILRNVDVFNEQIQQCGMKIVLEDRVFNFERIELLKDDRFIHGSGSIDGGDFQLKLATADPMLMERMWIFRELKIPFTGEMNLTAEGSGSLDGKKLSATASVNWDHVSFQGRSWRGGKGVFRLEGRTLKAEAELMNGRFLAKARTELGGEFPFQGTIKTPEKITRQDLNDLLGLRIPASDVSGQLTVDAKASGILNNLHQTNVEGVISDLVFDIKGIDLEATAPVPFTYSPGNGIRFESLKLVSGDSELSGILAIVPGGILEGTIEGGIDLGGFSFLQPTIDGFAGKSELQVRVAGSLSRPELNGFLNINDASCVAHVPFPVKIDDLTGRLEILGERLRFDSINGKVGKGTVQMQGDLFLEGLKPSRGRLEWKGEGIAVQFPEGLSTVNRVNMTFRLLDKKGDIRGVIRMDEGRYSKEIDLDNLLSFLEQRVEPGRKPAGREGDGNGDWLFLDLQMETVNPIQVEMKLLRGEAAGVLHLRGPVSKPVLAGRFSMEEGSIAYRGQVFELTHGTVGFFNPNVVEPNFDFSAKTDISGFDRDGLLRDYEIELVATGTPARFKLDLLSSPPLSQADIISLLNWGAVSDKVFGSGGGISPVEATFLLTGDLKGRLESGVQDITGFDRVVINPSTVSNTGETTPSVQFDKNLGERLSLRASSPILFSEESEVTLRYRVLDIFSLVGGQEGDQDYGLDLDFQIEIPE